MIWRATAKPSSCSRAGRDHELTLVDRPDNGHAVFEAECGKGTYVRALARDIGRILGCFGHICALRRTLVGPFRGTT